MDGSLGYASRLSHREDLGGGLGAREYLDSASDVLVKAGELACMLSTAKHVVVYTGAGISTSCGIPDFRGPQGVWTLQRQGQPPPKASVRFDHAYPSLTHMVLVGLQRMGRLALVVSQNVDCLHIRSGLPRERLAELHGNCFLEVCDTCRREYVRDFEVPSVGLKHTGRACEHCRGALRDQCLDWDNELPADDMARSKQETDKADLVLCLGTSLQITPACNMPLRATRRGGKLVIVNLQRTPKDAKAALVVRARVDAVMARVARTLGVAVPPYVRVDRVRVRHVLLDGGMRVELKLLSVHGDDAPLPWLEACEVVCTPPAEPQLAQLSEAGGWCAQLHCPAGAGELVLTLRFALSALCTLCSASGQHTITLRAARAKATAAESGETELAFETVRFEHDLNAAIAAADGEITAAAAAGARGGDAHRPSLVQGKRKAAAPVAAAVSARPRRAARSGPA